MRKENLAKTTLVGAGASTKVTLFTNDEFGTVRTTVINGEPWFVGKDVASALGYENQNRDIARHVDEDDRVMIDGKSQYQNGIELGQRGGWVINESGVYALVFGSKLPRAKEFKRWVTREVLPEAKAKSSNAKELTTTTVDGIEIVQDNGESLVDSRSVAENFGKEHKHVLESIDSLVAQNSATKTMFHQCSREYRGQQFRYFTMNRDGFSLLVMGFTGKEALNWKLKYIAAFNAMEKKLTSLPDFSNPAIAARAWADAIEAKQSAEAQVAELAPKAEFYDTVADSSTLISMGDAAKLLNLKGIGRNTLFRVLRDRGILQWDNVPYQRYVSAGYFEIKERYVEQYGDTTVKKTTFVTQRGLEWLHRTLNSATA